MVFVYYILAASRKRGPRAFPYDYSAHNTKEEIAHHDCF
jgi:hypothetical protein